MVTRVTSTKLHCKLICMSGTSRERSGIDVFNKFIYGFNAIHHGPYNIQKFLSTVGGGVRRARSSAIFNLMIRPSTSLLNTSKMQFKI